MGNATQALDAFVRDALGRGQSKDAVGAALKAAGWTAEQIEDALDDYADVPFPVPVPRPRASVSARETFLYLVLFSSLFFAAWHLGSLVFDLINRAWPDPAGNSYLFEQGARSLRWSTAAVLIAFPVFAFVAYRLGREIAKQPVKRLSPVRRWLTYLTLFVAAATLIGDMTTLVYNVLGGEMTLRFALKVLVVAAIAGTIFGYYLWDLRREEPKP